jgi:hypothetical protein
MTDFQKQMNQAIDALVAQVTEIARRWATGTLESTFSGNGAPARSTAVIPSPGPGRLRVGRGAKRSQEDLGALSDRLRAFVKANDDQGTRAADPEAHRRGDARDQRSEAVDDVFSSAVSISSTTCACLRRR